MTEHFHSLWLSNYIPLAFLNRIIDQQNNYFFPLTVFATHIPNICDG